jgi:hypothetical protein
LQLIFSGASLALCALFFAFFYLYIRRRTASERILADSQDEVNRLIAEIDRATDRDARLVEERISSLRKILEEADRRIALLSRDLDRRQASAELYTALGKAPSVSQTAPPAAPGAGPLPAASPPLSTLSSAVPGAPGPSSPAAPSAAAVPAVRPLTERVAELSRQGFAAELIAARLGVSLSEVELAIAVSRRRGARPPPLSG